MRKVVSAFLVLTAPLGGAAFLYGGSLLAIVLWGLVSQKLDAMQVEYSWTFGLIGLVPLVGSGLWVMAALNVLGRQPRTIAAVLFLVGAAACGWWVLK